MEAEKDRFLKNNQDYYKFLRQSVELYGTASVSKIQSTNLKVPQIIKRSMEKVSDRKQQLRKAFGGSAKQSKEAGPVKLLRQSVKNNDHQKSVFMISEKQLERSETFQSIDVFETQQLSKILSKDGPKILETTDEEEQEPEQDMDSPLLPLL